MAAEIRPIEGSFVRESIDPDGKLPDVALIPDVRPNYHANTDNYLLTDKEGNTLGEAVVVRMKSEERYLTRLEIADKDREPELRLAAYVLAIEDTTINHGEAFVNDELADYYRDVEVWWRLKGRRVAEEHEEFRPLHRKGGESDSDLWTGNYSVSPPIATSTD